MDNISVLIVDDHPLFRQGVRLFLESQAGIDVAGEAGDGTAATAFLEKSPVACVLLDLQMPGKSGIEVARNIKDRWPDTRILVLTSFNSWDMIYPALKAGASGYILKDAPPPELLAAIRAVAAGGRYLDEEVASRLLSGLTEPSEKDPAAQDAGLAGTLTPRELEVLREIAQGLDNKEIAAKLFLSEKTVKTHVASILQKLDVKSRTQAALYALQRGLV
ncbi:MAG: response regulator [Bacillota bacterium]